MAKTNRQTVAELATASGLDLDEVLLSLWDEGFTDLLDPNDSLVGTMLNRAKKVLGIPTRRDLKSPSYWQKLFGLDTQQFTEVLNSLNINMHPGLKTLPKGAVKKLSFESRRRLASAIPQPQMISKEVSEQKVTPEFDWKIIGHRKNLRMLEVNEVKKIHDALVVDFSAAEDPINPSGPRNEHLLGSAVFRPQTSIGAESKYPTVEMSAAALLHSLVHNHPFHNGNKRTALVSLLVFLDENGATLTCNDDDLFRFVLHVAQHKITNSHPNNLADREVLSIAEWICKNSRPVEHGERPLPFRKLRQILTRYGCEFEHGSTGSKIKISRKIVKRSILGPNRKKILFVTTYYGGEGREVSQNAINDIRSSLHLNDNNGCDSAAFYEETPQSVDDFIVRYRKILRRLARL